MIRELIAAVLLASIAAGYYALAISIDASALADEVGPSGLPVVYAGTLGALAIALAVRAVGVRFLSGAETAAHTDAHWHTVGRAAGMLGIGVLYLACVTVLGYVASVAAVIFAVAAYQGEQPGRRLAAIAAGGALSFWAFFVVLLGIEMPTGFWPIIWGGEWIR